MPTPLPHALIRLALLAGAVAPAPLLAAAQEVPAAEKEEEGIPLSETIVVTGRREAALAASFETRHALESAEVAALGAANVGEIARRLPSAHLPVNSRGERIVFLRNAGERQVGLFYEGAAINVPWDNRLDLDLLPAALVGGARLAAGPLAPHYGVNALGAVSFSPRDAGDGLRATLAAGSRDRREGEVFVPLLDGRGGGAELALGGSHAQRDGDPLSDEADLPFFQSSDKTRTNSDTRLSSLFGRVGGELGGGAHRLGLTAFHAWGRKGIAPEGDRASGARFWRYPEVAHTLVVANAKSRLGDGVELDSAAWAQQFGQTIDSYINANYDTVATRQVDRDRTYGVRELVRHEMGPLTLVGSANLLVSTHRQRDIPYSGGNPPATLPAALLYRQRNWSIGAEAEYAFSDRLVGEAGIGWDEVDYLRTGDKPPIADARGWTGRAGLVFDAGSGWRLRAAAGRKLRMPTMRELFGQALNRFLINPDLRPERIATFELGAEWRGRGGEIFVIPFVQDVKDTIDQHNVGPLRQRINLEGSTVRGVELGGAWRIDPVWSLSGNATWSRVRRKDAPTEAINRLAEKPALLARARLDYVHPGGFSTALEAEHVGRAWSADAGGTLRPLERSTSFNWRAGYGFEAAGAKAELFLHVDNITDTLVEPQLGLPAPGRAIRLGFRVG